MSLGDEIQSVFEAVKTNPAKLGELQAACEPLVKKRVAYLGRNLAGRKEDLESKAWEVVFKTIHDVAKSNKQIDNFTAYLTAALNAQLRAEFTRLTDKRWRTLPDDEKSVFEWLSSLTERSIFEDWDAYRRHPDFYDWLPDWLKVAIQEKKKFVGKLMDVLEYVCLEDKEDHEAGDKIKVVRAIKKQFEESKPKPLNHSALGRQLGMGRDKVKRLLESVAKRFQQKCGAESNPSPAAVLEKLFKPSLQSRSDHSLSS
jgi:hypothetical protein